MELGVNRKQLLLEYFFFFSENDYLALFTNKFLFFFLFFFSFRKLFLKNFLEGNHNGTRDRAIKILSMFKITFDQSHCF